MLAKEKRRTLWSLAIGTMISSIVFANFYWQARSEEAHLEDLQKEAEIKCPANIKSAKLPAECKKGADFIDPKDIVSDLEIGSPLDRKITRISGRAVQAHENSQFYGFLVLAIFALPLAWYF